MHRNALRLAVILTVICAAHATLRADESARGKQLEKTFKAEVGPFLKTHCLSCHGAEVQEAKLDLSPFQSVEDVAKHHQVWETVLERLEAEEMPPEDARKHPATKQRKEVVDWIRAVRDYEARRNAGDPGPVLARRLSNAEYNYAVRDLTGVGIRPTQTFPVDPANAAGFDNSGESLAMSPALLKKYLEASRQVADHMVLSPRGIAFAEHPVVTDTDRDKYCVRRIIDFYQRQPTDLADYFYACKLVAETRGLLTVEAAAKRLKLSVPYARRVWRILHEDDAAGPTAELQRRFAGIPSADDEASARESCVAMRDYVRRIRRQLSHQFEDLKVSGSHKGSQPFVLWKNRQYAAHRRKLNVEALYAPAEIKEDTPQELAVPRDPSQRAGFIESVKRFCDTFPNVFYVSERGRDYLGVPRDQQEKGRLLSAGFHSMMGYFRDDRPLYDLILDDAGRRELDLLWDELNSIASAPTRQYAGFLWFERTDSRYMRDPEFDFARAEDKSAASAKMIKALAEVYLDKARRSGGSDVAIKAVEDFFQQIDSQIRRAERLLLEAEPDHLRWLEGFAERAWRRRLSEQEKHGVRAFYFRLREEERMSHEDAMRDSCVSILMSPHFLYRLDLASGGEGVRQLTDLELASRLSFFVWSSIPDETLLDAAEKSSLTASGELRAQVRRMLADERVRALTVEFAANWLDVRRFEQHNAVDRGRFPEFDDALRSAMFEEPIRFLEDLIRRDGSVLELLEAKHTFVNAPLAKHYGMEGLEFATHEWRRVDGADKYGRGGLLPMSVFLTKNSPGLRTSPVKRGYWVVRRLLGERIPPPPPDVPELPEDESKLGDLSLREMLARHRDNKSCAGCHDRFDSIGLAFEGYGPVGRLRKQDLGGRPVETSAVFPPVGSEEEGVEGDGVEGLRRYLRQHRRAEFVDNLCRKLLAFALGRTLMLSDEPLIAKMKSKLADGGYRFSSLVESIVSSRQFLYKRGASHVVGNLK